MARRGVTLVLAAALCGSLAASPVCAESVPLPTPAPLPKSTSPMSAPPAATAPASTNSAPAEQSRGFFPFSNPFATAPTTTTNFDPKQRALLDRISMYLSSIQTMVGNFVQIGPDGA